MTEGRQERLQPHELQTSIRYPGMIDVSCRCEWRPEAGAVDMASARDLFQRHVMDVATRVQDAPEDSTMLGPDYCNDLAPFENGVHVRCSMAVGHPGNQHSGMGRTWDAPVVEPEQTTKCDAGCPEPTCANCPGVSNTTTNDRWWAAGHDRCVSCRTIADVNGENVCLDCHRERDTTTNLATPEQYEQRGYRNGTHDERARIERDMRDVFEIAAKSGMPLTTTAVMRAIRGGDDA